MKSIISLSVFLLLFVFNPVCYCDENQIADSSYGQESYPKDRIAGSIRDFARTLFFNPGNAGARKQLVQLVDNPSLDALTKSQIISINDLFLLNENLKNRKEYFAEKISEFKSYLISRGISSKFLDQQLSLISSSRYESVDENQRPPSNDPVTELLQKLSQNRDKLLNGVLSLQKQMDKLREVSRSYSFRPEPRRDIPSVGTASKNNPTVSRDDLQFLKEEISFLKGRVSILEKTVEDKDRKLAGLNQQIVDLSLEVAQREISANQRMLGFENLKDEMIDLESRFRLNQEIIREKDQTIDKIERKLAALEAMLIKQRSEFNQLMASRTEKLAEIAGILEIYQFKLSETSGQLKRQKSTADSLEDQLIFVRHKLFDNKRELATTLDSIELLQIGLGRLEEGVVKSGSRKVSSRLQWSKMLKDIDALKERIKKMETSL